MTDLRARILRGDRLVGCFLKTPSPQVAELLGLGGLDFIVADQEHAPVDLATLDLIALAGRAVGLPVLIRASHAAAPAIWPALDLGCAGVMVPHIRDAGGAGLVADAVKYARGQRGFSPSGRAGGYGTIPATDYRRHADATTVIMAQIEDAQALQHLDAIAAVPDVDVLFVGPADLALSLGCGTDAPELTAAIARVADAARKAGKAAGLFVTDATQIGPWAAKGVSVFVCGSDQGILVNGARRLMTTGHDA